MNPELTTWLRLEQGGQTLRKEGAAIIASLGASPFPVPNPALAPHCSQTQAHTPTLPVPTGSGLCLLLQHLSSRGSFVSMLWFWIWHFGIKYWIRCVILNQCPNLSEPPNSYLRNGSNNWNCLEKAVMIAWVRPCDVVSMGPGTSPLQLLLFWPLLLKAFSSAWGDSKMLKTKSSLQRTLHQEREVKEIQKLL